MNDLNGVTDVNDQAWINPAHIRFSRDEEGGGSLIASWEGHGAPVIVRRLFPMTRGDCCISVAGLDGQEWGVLKTTAGLDESSRAALEMELRISPYLPFIKRIMTIRRRFNQFMWEVQTDYGQLCFKTGPIYEAIVILQNGARLLTDLEDQKYMISSDRRIDRSSRKLLAKWL